MKVYVRKVFPHDITHEVGVKTEIVNNFFEGKTKDIKMVGKKSGFEKVVNINSATDPRFGGDFKTLLSDEGNIDVNDIILIYKYGDGLFKLQIMKKDDEGYLDLLAMFREKARHAFIDLDEEL